MTYEIKPNEQFKSLEIYFSEKPEAETRDALKALHFRWNPKKSCWYGFADLATLSETLESVTGKKPEENAVVIPDACKINEGTLYEGWQGGNYHNWKDGDDLKAQLKAAFKKTGLKVTIRERSNGYSYCFYFTITLSRSKDLKPFELYKETTRNRYYNGSDFVYYNDENGKTQSIFGEKLGTLPEEEQAAIIKKHIEFCYNFELKETIYFPKELETLNEEGNRKFLLLHEIVSSFNKDESNSQIDYFDRGFYDRYCLKIVD